MAGLASTEEEEGKGCTPDPGPILLPIIGMAFFSVPAVLLTWSNHLKEWFFFLLSGYGGLIMGGVFARVRRSRPKQDDLEMEPIQVSQK